MSHSCQDTLDENDAQSYKFFTGFIYKAFAYMCALLLEQKNYIHVLKHFIEKVRQTMAYGKYNLNDIK